jgi:glycosyltransferase involved in cell wall biosynthesis
MNEQVKKISVAIDATRLSKTRTGIDYYTYYLIKTFFEQRNSFCHDFQFTIFVSREGNDLIKSVLETTDQFSVIQVPFQHPLFRQQLGLLWANLVHQEPFDLFHSMGFPFPVSIKAKRKLITVHDIAFHTFPKTFTLASRLLWNYLFPKTLKKTDGIISISQSTQSDLFKYYPNTKEKPFWVIYYGLSPYYLNYSDSNPNESKKKYNLPEKYVLCVATLQPRKNIPFIIEVMKLFWEKYPEKGDLHLVLVGNKGWFFNDILEKIHNPLISSRIHFTGYIDESELPGIYANANVFVYPSLYEGLGLPPLESMACGTPVIVSDRSSLPEIIGEAGISLPLEIDLWIKEIHKMTEDENYTKILQAKGKEHVKSFTWESCAQKVIDSYRSILGIQKDIKG